MGQTNFTPQDTTQGATQYIRRSSLMSQRRMEPGPFKTKQNIQWSTIVFLLGTVVQTQMNEIKFNLPGLHK